MYAFFLLVSGQCFKFHQMMPKLKLFPRQSCCVYGNQFYTHLMIAPKYGLPDTWCKIERVSMTRKCQMTGHPMALQRIDTRTKTNK